MGRANGIAAHFRLVTRGYLLAWLPRHGDALRNLLREAWLEYERDYARYFAVAMIYYALVSLVPLLLLVLAAFGWLLRLSPKVANAERQVLAAVETGFGLELRSGLEQLLEWLREQSVLSTVLSVIGLAFTASVLVRQLRMSMRAIWRQAPPLLSGSLRGGAWQTFLETAIAFVMVFGGGLLLFAALAIVVSVHWVGGLLSEVPLLGPGVDRLIAVGVPFVVVFVIFAALFRFLPPVQLRLRHVWLAALLCSVGWSIGVEILALYGMSSARQRRGLRRSRRSPRRHALDEAREPALLLRGRGLQGRLVQGHERNSRGARND